MVADQIEREVLIDAPVERVWALITEAEHVGTWFGDAGAEIDLRPGGEIVFRWAEHGVSYGRVEAVEPPHRFAYRWVPLVPREKPREGNATLVEFTLAAEGAGTRLRVVESGFQALQIDEDRRIATVEGNTRGWRAELQDLVDYAAQLPAEQPARG